MILYSADEDSDSRDSDTSSMAGEDADVFLNHYRIPKLQRFGGINGGHNPPKRSSNRNQVKYCNEGKILSLTELAAQKVACHLPFGQVENFDPLVPEPVQCRIAYWSFPQDEDDVRLYTCLANGNADVFIRAEDLISLGCVCDMLQVGFHLSANVKSVQDSTDDQDCFRVAITFDRRRITSCSCSCSASTVWCQHAVAVSLQRIRKPQESTLRAPVSESLQRLEKNQLQKFAQYLINELPQQILPAAQRLLDELLSGDDARINKNPAAPDPTAGALADEQTSWCLDDTHLSADIQRLLHKQCTTQPTVCSDISALHTTAPPAASEYSQLLRAIRGREPEGLWNLISIVGEMMKRHDSNYLLLLDIMTGEVLKCEKIITWWFETRVSLQTGNMSHCSSSKGSLQSTSQYSCSNLCDEIVHLWRLAAINPSLSEKDRKDLYKKLFDWHLEILKRHHSKPDTSSSNNKPKRIILELFPGFKSALEGCLINWSDWDDKKCRIVPIVEDPEAAGQVKVMKKKKKKKSRNAKQATEKAACVESQEEPTNNEPADMLEAKAESENEPPENHIAVPREDGNQEPNVDNQRQSLQDLNQLQNVERDLQVYFMERPVNDPEEQQEELIEDLIKPNARRLNDPLETLFAKAEGLFAHGHLEEAQKLAIQVASELINQPSPYPSLKQCYNNPKRRKKKGNTDTQMSLAVSEALTKISFLCNVLIDNPENQNLIFRLALFGLEMKRYSSPSKLLEVKLINQKQDLIMLLKTITLHEEELTILRERATAICEGTYENKSDGLMTLLLGKYLFEVLVSSKSPPCPSCCPRHSSASAESKRSLTTGPYPHAANYPLASDEHNLSQQNEAQNGNPHNCDQFRQQGLIAVYGKLPSDISLGFQTALDALSVKIGSHELDHPLLCEGTRRQRGELAIVLLTHYKDEQEKLDLILTHLFDKDVFSPPVIPTTGPAAAAPSEVRTTKKSNSLQEPNQLAEASAHFMFELAKTVFEKAGGNSSTTHLFRPQLVTQNGVRGIHRRLHMCCLRIALYALGLNNRASPNWMQRTYNGRASFIHDQALEIGLPAFKFLVENWEGYLTPVEAASIADKAGCSNDPEIKRVAAEMSKSCLKYAHYLDFNAVRRILDQCKEQCIAMIEDACSDIEQVADTENVCADVLFVAARAWYNLAGFESSSGCHQSVKNASMVEQDTGASGWLVNGSHLDKCQQYGIAPVHPIHWGTNVYSRVDFDTTLNSSSHKQMEYEKSAYRVGIRALNVLKPTLHINSKHNPKKEDDVLWLLSLSKSLGIDCVRKFSLSAIENITNPQVLNTICCDLIGCVPPGDEFDRNSIVLPLIEKCLERFIKQVSDLMKHISYDQKSYVESILDAAENLMESAFNVTTAKQFGELLRVVDSRRSKKNRFYIDTTKWRTSLDALWCRLNSCTCLECQTARDLAVKGPGYQRLCISQDELRRHRLET